METHLIEQPPIVSHVQIDANHVVGRSLELVICKNRRRPRQKCPPLVVTEFGSTKGRTNAAVRNSGKPRNIVWIAGYVRASASLITPSPLRSIFSSGYNESAPHEGHRVGVRSPPQNVNVFGRLCVCDVSAAMQDNLPVDIGL